MKQHEKMNHVSSNLTLRISTAADATPESNRINNRKKATHEGRSFDLSQENDGITYKYIAAHC